MENSQPVPMLKTRLSVQMFLQFAIWGSWAPVLAVHMSEMKFSGEQIGLVYLTGPIALMISPLIAGQLADRYFATQKYLGLSYLASAVALFVAATATDYGSLWLYALLFMLFFGPTLGLANSLCFHHLKNPQKEFAAVRLWGTLGWIFAGLVLSIWMKTTGRPIGDCLNIGGVFAVICGIYSFTLPKTPPKGDATESFALGKVLGMLKDPSFAAFTILCMLLLMFATGYYNLAGFFLSSGMQVEQSNVSLVMLVGQILEILTMLILPWSLSTLGTKKTVLIGVAAWGLRFFCFSLGAPKELVLASQALHGFCFAFAIAAAMIYVEKICTPDVRGSMQSFLAFSTYGVGMAVGSVLYGKLLGMYTVNNVINWSKVWMVGAVGCAVVFVGLLIAFTARDSKNVPTPEPELAGAGKS